MNEQEKLAALKKELLQKKREIQDEINHYPPPIPACDQQFNHLLEQRSSIAKDLRKIDLIRYDDEIKVLFEKYSLITPQF